MSSEALLFDWADYVTDRLSAPAAPFPDAGLLGRLGATFAAHAAFYFEAADGSFGMLAPDWPAGWPPTSQDDYWSQEWSRHPLVQWAVGTGSLAPISLARVPDRIASRRDRAWVRERVPAQLHQQMSIHLAPLHRGATVALGRGGEDFSADEVLLAVRLQPLLVVLLRQAVLTTRCSLTDGPELTGREVAVLALLVEGLTAAGIGRRLACSERTVHKHLEHLYRKLGVRDRLQAVRVARNLSLAPGRPLGPQDRAEREGGSLLAITGPAALTAASRHDADAPRTTTPA